jgi:hypothetical protein
MAELLFKEAESLLELHQVHALNHRIFAEEIGQHQTNPFALLIDHLHTQNRYFIAVRDSVVVGMISASSGPVFSIAKRLSNIQIIRNLPRPVELRLLAIDPQQRNRTLLAGLLWQAYSFALSNGFSHLLISAIAEKEGMYRKLGFVSLGPAVPEGSANFIPMMMTVLDQRSTNREQIQLHQRYWQRAARKSCCLPAPTSLPSRWRNAREPMQSGNFERDLPRYEGSVVRKGVFGEGS